MEKLSQKSRFPMSLGKQGALAVCLPGDRDEGRVAAVPLDERLLFSLPQSAPSVPHLASSLVLPACFCRLWCLQPLMVMVVVESYQWQSELFLVQFSALISDLSSDLCAVLQMWELISLRAGAAGPRPCSDPEAHGHYIRVHSVLFWLPGALSASEMLTSPPTGHCQGLLSDSCDRTLRSRLFACRICLRVMPGGGGWVR